MSPRLTIVTPSLNQVRYLEQTLDSVLSQGYPDLEYIVIDGGSTDGSVEILRKYQRHLSFWVSEPDRGQGHALNKGFARATGTILGWINADDYYEPGVFAEMSEHLRSRPELGVISGRCRLSAADGSGTLLPPSPLRSYEDFLRVDSNWTSQRLIVQPEAFFRAEAWHLAGGLRESLHYCLDVALWIDMARAGVLFDSVDSHWASLRLHEAQKTHELSQAYAELARHAWSSLRLDWSRFGDAAPEIADEIFRLMSRLRSQDRADFERIRASSSYRLGRLATRFKFW